MMNLFILLVIFGVVSSSFADYDVQLEVRINFQRINKHALKKNHFDLKLEILFF